MARSKAENEAISDKVRKLMNEGFEERQAQAIAFRMYREGELRYSRPTRKRKGYNQNKVNAAIKLLGLRSLIRRKKTKK